MQPIIDRNKEAIRALARKYGVSRLEVFGSVCTPDWDPERSDVDFLVEYPANYDFGPWLARHQDLEADLGSLLGRHVDLVMIGALRRDRFRQEADRTRTVIYDAATIADVA